MVEFVTLNGIMGDATRFVMEKQLKNRDLWAKCVEVYGTKEDGLDEGWRGEFFGKMMRGASLIFKVTRDRELFDVLTDAVVRLLDKQESNGRFSTYPIEKEFCGWDIWCRKYLLTGLLHYIDVCTDDGLKERVLAALKKHLDYIVAHIGDGETKKRITETSTWWGCVNSCSILEPVVEMYKRTGERSYLGFADYIIAEGGCKDGNLFELALAGEKAPYQYPVVKAYEMMSFFEGVLAYHEVSGKQEYLTAVKSFVNQIILTDTTVVGGAGCSHELFDHSSTTQTNATKKLMQETCVTVTLMRLLTRLYALTLDARYVDYIEKSGLNALYGSINTEYCEQYSFERKERVPAMTFDSYSPLCFGVRGRGIGGFKQFQSGGMNGCCNAIGACGVALMPLVAIYEKDGCYYINYPMNGEVRIGNGDRSGSLLFESHYPALGKAKITVSCQSKLFATIYLRKPAWCEAMTIDGVAAGKDSNYCLLGTEFCDKQEIAINYETKLTQTQLNDKVAFSYGPLTLCADEAKSKRRIKKPVALRAALEYQLMPTQDRELVRLSLKLKGTDSLLLTDYQSCGKKWTNRRSRLNVWFINK